MPFKALAAVVATAVLIASASAQDQASIGAFAGQWVGKVTVETMGPTDFPSTVRETGVTITPDENGGFSLEWSTVRRESGDRQAPDETVQDSQIAFRRGAVEGRWTAPAAETGPRWFARLNGSTLTITGFALLEDGQAELQTYRRTLEGNEMALIYTRVVDGDLKRRASGALTRFAE